MAAYGVTAEGFVPISLDELLEDLKTRLRAKLSITLPLTPDTDIGIMAGIMADMLGEPSAVAEALWFAFDEAAAGGAALDNLASITGSTREQARPSTATVTATGDAGTVLPTARVVSVPATGVRFTTTQAVTLVAATAWQTSFPYSLGARVRTNVASTQRVYQCVTAGASASSGTGPSGIGPTVADGTVLWRYLGEGGGVGDAPAQASVTGPLSALAYTLTGIETPVAGWRSTTNTLDAVLGTDRETDAVFRLRRRAELRGLGKASVAAVRELLAGVAGVTSAYVFENDTDATNADGMPPHSIEALVEGGTTQAILDALWDAKAAGIATVGTTSGTVVDSEGVSHTVRFTRPTILTIWLSQTVSLTPDAPADNAQVLALLQAAQLAYLDGLPAGRDVVVSKSSAASADFDWVADVQLAKVGLSSGTLGTANIPVSTRQRADGDTSRMAFTLVRLAPEDL